MQRRNSGRAKNMFTTGFSCFQLISQLLRVCSLIVLGHQGWGKHALNMLPEGEAMHHHSEQSHRWETQQGKGSEQDRFWPRGDIQEDSLGFYKLTVICWHSNELNHYTFRAQRQILFKNSVFPPSVSSNVFIDYCWFLIRLNWAPPLR